LTEEAALADGLDAFLQERQVRVDRWAAEHAIAHSPRQLSQQVLSTSNWTYLVWELQVLLVSLIQSIV
jgi:hypothetical protein